MRLRPLTDAAAEIEIVDGLLMRAYRFSSRRRDLEAYLAAQPDGWFVIVDRGEIVAVAGALAYGSFCWLGLVATDPVRQREGLASKLSARLVAWAHDKGCKTIALEASAAGRPLYERLGFRMVGETLELSPPSDVAPRKPASAVRRCANRVEELVALDEQIFGGDRGRLLHALSHDKDCRCYVATYDDRLAGYLFGRTRLLGPGCARTADVACDLVHAALSDGDARTMIEPQHLLLPIESRHLDALLSLGFRIQRRLPHMRLGNPVLPGKRDLLLAQTSYAAG